MLVTYQDLIQRQCIVLLPYNTMGKIIMSPHEIIPFFLYNYNKKKE